MAASDRKGQANVLTAKLRGLIWKCSRAKRFSGAEPTSAGAAAAAPISGAEPGRADFTAKRSSYLKLRGGLIISDFVKFISCAGIYLKKEIVL